MSLSGTQKVFLPILGLIKPFQLPISGHIFQVISTFLYQNIHVTEENNPESLCCILVSLMVRLLLSFAGIYIVLYNKACEHHGAFKCTS